SILSPSLLRGTLRGITTKAGEETPESSAPAERRYRPDPLGFPHEVRAAVLGPGLFVMSRGKGTFLAIADGFHPVGRDSLTYEVLLGRIGPPVSQCQVVLF